MSIVSSGVIALIMSSSRTIKCNQATWALTPQNFLSHRKPSRFKAISSKDASLDVLPVETQQYIGATSLPSDAAASPRPLQEDAIRQQDCRLVG